MNDERRRKHKLDVAAHLSIFEKRIRQKLFIGIKSAAKPRALIYGGQPGAGKSMSIRAAIAEFGDERPAAIIGDELRGYHPRYEELLVVNDSTAAFYTDSDTAGWVELAIDHAKRNRFSMVIEGTMRNPDKVAETTTSLREAGYAIHANIIVVKHAYSWQGVLERFETQKADKGQGRMTTAEAHDAAYKGMIATVDRVESNKLADSITLLRRDGPFHQRQLADGRWSTRRTAGTAIKQERARAETPAEIRSLIAGYERIEAFMKRPERDASPEEIKAVEELRSAAQKKLLHATDLAASAAKGATAAKPKGGKDPFE